MVQFFSSVRPLLKCLLLIAVGVVVAAPAAQAGPKIKGYRWFKFGERNTTVSFGCDGISNPSPENATGSLLLSLWAFDRPYGNGDARGKELATYKLKGMGPDSSYSDVKKTANTSLPSTRKSYTISLLLSEFKDGQYVVVNYFNFEGTTVLGPLPSFTMSGPWRWQTSNEGGTIDIEVAKIINNRKSTSGTLRLVAWATREPYTTSSIGYTLGTVKKNPLKAGYSYSDVANTAQYTRPPPGYYFVTLLLTEFDGNEYLRQATLTSREATLFR